MSTVFWLSCSVPVCLTQPPPHKPHLHSHPPQARLSSIEDLRPRGFSFHGRTSGQYVLYVYPSAAQGPRAPGARTVVVLHRWAGGEGGRGGLIGVAGLALGWVLLASKPALSLQSPPPAWRPNLSPPLVPLPHTKQGQVQVRQRHPARHPALCARRRRPGGRAARGARQLGRAGGGPRRRAGRAAPPAQVRWGGLLGRPGRGSTLPRLGRGGMPKGGQRRP